MPMALSDANFNANLAAELSRLESATAVLERDARNRRALLSELGIVSHSTSALLLRWLMAQSRWLDRLARSTRAGFRAAVARERALRPHLATAVRVTWSWLHDVAVIGSAACVALIPFVLAILIFATPE
jgi:hypothetical protein